MKKSEWKYSLGLGEQGKKAAVGRKEQEFQKQDSKKRNPHGLWTHTPSLTDNLEKYTSMYIFILLPRDFVQRSFSSTYSYRRSLLFLKQFRPCLPCPICLKPSCSNIFLSRTFPLNWHVLSPWHLRYKTKLFMCMKITSLLSTLFYEKCKLVDFPYEHMDLVDKAISST